MILHSDIANFLNYWLSFASLVGLGVIVLWVLVLIIPKKHPLVHQFFDVVSRYGLPIGFFVSLIGMKFSLIYSEYIGYLPCALCWFQRIALYPLVFLFAIAWWKKDRNVYRYTAALSAIGLVISLYHHYLQMGYDAFIPCAANAVFVDCAKPSFVEFGFVSFPFMAAVLFGFLLLLSLVMRRENRLN